MFQLRPVESKKDWNEFINLPWSIYMGDPYWVPPLKVAVRDVLDVNKNPFFKHALMHPLVAMKDGKCVGRIIGVIDEAHNTTHNEQVVFFGFYESIDDQLLANALLDEVAKWGKSKGMTVLRGPVNPSTNHECGLLIKGYDDPPAVMMTYNPPYYAELLEKYGLTKSMDLLAYEIRPDSRFSEKILAHAERLRQSASVTFRPINLKNFQQEVDTILEIYNDAWESNWGFVPMSRDEFQHMAKDMKAIVDPELLLIAYVKDKPAGFALALPDVNQAIHKIKDGNLFPTGILKLLWHTKGPFRRKTVNRCRVITLGVKKAYRELGIGPLLYTEYIRKGPALGYTRGEASWILETNKPMNKALENMGTRPVKTYRIYDRTLT